MQLRLLRLGVQTHGKMLHLQMPVPSCAISGSRHSLVTLVMLVTLVGWRSVESLGLATQAWLWRHSRLKLWATQDPGHAMLSPGSLLESCMVKFRN